MQSNSDLFFLIQSLDNEARKGFRKAVRQKEHRGPSLYLRLFDVLAKQEVFDEALTKSHFEGEPCLKQFTRIKHYLYEQLLSFLTRENRTQRAAEQIRIHLRETRLLQNLGLPAQALKRLSRAKALVNQYHFTVMRPELLALERELLRRQGVKKLAAQVERLNKEEGKAILDLQLESEARQAYDQELLLAQQGHGDGLSQADIDSNPASPNPNAPFNAQLAIHLRAALSYRRRQLRKEAHQQYQIAFQIWQDNPHQIQEFPERFFRLTSAYFASGHSIGEYAGFGEWLEQLQLDQAMPKPLRNNLLCMSYNLQLLFHLNQQQLTEAHALVPGLVQVLRFSSPNLSSWLPAATNLAVLYFISGRYPDAKGWIDRILDLPRGTERTDLRELARTMHLVVLYETGSRELIPYAWRSTERFIRKHRPLNQLEMALGVFFRKADQAITAKDERKALLRLRDKITEIGDDQGLVGLEEVGLWTNQKLNLSTEGPQF